MKNVFTRQIIPVVTKNDLIYQKVCYPCDYKATNVGNLKTHIQSIHEGVCYSCDQCDYKATEKGSLKKHVESIHEGVRYSCDYCEYKATRKEHLKRHLKSIHG